jgi:hypothetical protein
MSKPSSKRNRKPASVPGPLNNGKRPTIIETPAQTTSRALLERFSLECIGAKVPMIIIAPWLAGSRFPCITVAGPVNKQDIPKYVSLANRELANAMCNMIAGAPAVPLEEKESPDGNEDEESEGGPEPPGARRIITP